MTPFCVCGELMTGSQTNGTPIWSCHVCGLTVGTPYAHSLDELADMWTSETMHGAGAVGLDPDAYVLAVKNNHATQVVDVRKIRAYATGAAAYLYETPHEVGLVFQTINGTRVEIDLPLEHVDAVLANLQEITADLHAAEREAVGE